ncbi:MAG: ABC transporter substrate-binding protein [Nocardioides sp.]
MVRIRIAQVSALALGATLALTGCSNGGGGGSGDDKVVSGGTMTIAIASDPGSLDPQRSVNGVNLLMSVFAYDTPVTLLNSGQLAPQVVSKWTGTGTSYTLTVRKGVTCSDGSPMDAKTVAANINYVGNSKNGSGMNGVAVPDGTTAKADNAAGTVAVTLKSGAPFFMQNLAELPLVCSSAIGDRGSMKTSSVGSGPFVLDKVLPGDSYEYALRKGYTWGPNGATTATAGLPSKVIFKLVKSSATTTNLLLSKQVNVAQLSGPDTKRLQATHTFSSGGSIIGLELTFNQAAGQATSDVAVRQALVADLDTADLAKVSTGGLGTPANGLLTDPKICAGDTVTGNKPAFDTAKAGQMLDQAGWAMGSGGVRTKDGQPLAVSFVYNNETPADAATAEYIQSKWKALGVKVTLNGQTFEQQSAVVFGGKGTWGATLIGLGVSNPATLVPFFSGPVPTAGINYGAMNNKVYDQSVAAASGKAGTAGCDDWNKGESSLIKDSDITPLSVEPYLYWGNGAKFDVQARVLQPTSLRVLG